MGRFLSYQHGLALLTGLVMGLVFFDRNAINFLSPFIVADLKLTNAQLGTASSIVALSWAAAGYLVGRRSDRAGRRKPYYVATIIVFSICSMASGLAGGFLGLILTRLMMGAAEGPVPVLGNALLLGASTPSRRGLNMGLSCLGGLVAGALAPLILVYVATHLDWRAAFFLTGIPGLLAALAVARLVREAPMGIAATPQPAQNRRRSLDVLRVRNVWLCALISSQLVAGQTVALVFTPIFLVGLRHLKPADMSIAMSAFSFAAATGTPILCVLSDWLGRKPVVIGFATLTAAALCALYSAGTTAVIAATMAVAGFGAVLPALTIGVIPGESVADRDRGTALGLVMGAAEVIGGFAAAALAGLAADHFGQIILPAIASICVLSGALLTFALGETAPRRTGAAAIPAAPALVPSE
ncbi:MAG TPA: MFS transporter [Rhizomicrobium sp.]|nr:MFS transporter [Rhizomicrobium sp.]